MRDQAYEPCARWAKWMREVRSSLSLVVTVIDDHAITGGLVCGGSVLATVICIRETLRDSSQ